MLFFVALLITEYSGSACTTHISSLCKIAEGWLKWIYCSAYYLFQCFGHLYYPPTLRILKHDVSDFAIWFHVNGSFAMYYTHSVCNVLHTLQCLFNTTSNVVLSSAFYPLTKCQVLWLWQLHCNAYYPAALTLPKHTLHCNVLHTQCINKVWFKHCSSIALHCLLLPCLNTP